MDELEMPELPEFIDIGVISGGSVFPDVQLLRDSLLRERAVQFAESFAYATERKKPNKYRDIDIKSVDVLRSRMLHEFIAVAFKNTATDKEIRDYINTHSSLSVTMPTDSECIEALETLVQGGYKASIDTSRDYWYTNYLLSSSAYLTIEEPNTNSVRNIQFDFKSPLMLGHKVSRSINHINVRKEALAHVRENNSLFQDRFKYLNMDGTVNEIEYDFLPIILIINSRNLFIKYLVESIEETNKFRKSTNAHIDNNNNLVNSGQFGKSIFSLNREKKAYIRDKFGDISDKQFNRLIEVATQMTRRNMQLKIDKEFLDNSLKVAKELGIAVVKKDTVKTNKPDILQYGVVNNRFITANDRF